MEVPIPHAGCGAGWGSWCLGGGASLGSGALAELKETATHFERAAELSNAPAEKAELTELADWCHSQAEATSVQCPREAYMKAYLWATST